MPDNNIIVIKCGDCSLQTESSPGFLCLHQPGSWGSSLPWNDGLASGPHTSKMHLSPLCANCQGGCAAPSTLFRDLPGHSVLSVFFLPSASLCCCLVLVFVFRVTSWLCQAKERPDWDRSWSPEAALLTSPTIALVWVRCGFKNPKWNDLNEAVHFSPICKSGIMRPHQSGPGSLCLSVSYVWLPPPRPPRGLRW